MSLLALFKEHVHSHCHRNQMAEFLGGYYSGAHGVHMYHQLKECVKNDDEALYMWGKAMEHLYKNEQEKEDARKKMFDSMDKKSTGVITFDEWLAYSLEHITAKTATLDPHPIIDHGSVDQYKAFIKAALTNVGGPENIELYWFMLELFTDHDTNKCGQVSLSSFSPMMTELVKTAKKHGLPTPAEVSFLLISFTSDPSIQDQYEAIFKKYDPRGSNTLTIDEWMKLANEEVFKGFL